MGTNGQDYFFSLAEMPVCLSFAASRYNSIDLVPSMLPFSCNPPKEDTPLLFHLLIDDTLRPVEKSRRERIRNFDTGNGDTIVDRIDDGGYQFIIKDLNGGSCCLLIANADFSRCQCALNGNYNMRKFGLSNALMLVFSFSGAWHDALLIHASLVRQHGWGYAFIAKSGTGKSTQVSMWLRYIPDCDLMNDDNPIIRIVNGTPYIYGSPWSGKTPCYRNVKARLGALTRIDRADSNSVERLSPVQAFASVLPSCSSMKWEPKLFNRICDTVTKLIETTGIYILHCLPNEEAAHVCHDAIAKE